MISPDFQNMPADKVAFLTKLAAEGQTKNKSDLLPFLLSLSSRAAKSGFSFTDEETDLLIKHLTAGLSPQDKKKAELLGRISRMISSSQKQKPQ